MKYSRQTSLDGGVSTSAQHQIAKSRSVTLKIIHQIRLEGWVSSELVNWNLRWRRKQS